jgi:hypothetical protein
MGPRSHHPENSGFLDCFGECHLEMTCFEIELLAIVVSLGWSVVGTSEILPCHHQIHDSSVDSDSNKIFQDEPRVHWQELVGSDSHRGIVAKLDVDMVFERLGFETRAQPVLSGSIVILDVHSEVWFVEVEYYADTPPGSSEESARETHSCCQECSPFGLVFEPDVVMTITSCWELPEVTVKY